MTENYMFRPTLAIIRFFIPTREINKILCTEIDVLRRLARKSSTERIKNEHIKEIMGVKGSPNTIDIIEQKRLQWYGHVKRMPEERIPKLIVDWIQREREREKRTCKKNVDGRSTSSHDNRKFRTRSMEKQRGMAIGFRKTATAVKNWIDR
jgi:hypothetical protein